MTKIKPIRDHVVISRDVAARETEAGIILPEATSEKEKPQRGVVIAAGPGRDKDHPVSVTEGDVVYFAKYSGTELNIEGTDYLVLKESDILVALSS